MDCFLITLMLVSVMCFMNNHYHNKKLFSFVSLRGISATNLGCAMFCNGLSPREF